MSDINAPVKDVLSSHVYEIIVRIYLLISAFREILSYSLQLRRERPTVSKFFLMAGQTAVS